VIAVERKIKLRNVGYQRQKERTVTMKTDLPPLGYWEATASQSRFVQYTSQIEQAAILAAHERARIPTKALDIGCEGGRWSLLLAERGWQLICTDTNARALALCQQRIPTATCVLAHDDERTLPAADQSLGLVLCIEVVPVMPSTWFRQEVMRVLQPGGLLVGVFWNQWSWRGLLHHTAARLQHKQDDWYSEAYPRWRKCMRKQGFLFVQEEGCYWPPFRHRTSNSPLIPLACCIERVLGLHKLVSLSPLIIFVAQKQ
jgi:SAM-dependent methyltransferase